MVPEMKSIVLTAIVTGFLQDCTMNEMIDHCLQFLDEFNKDMEHPYTKEEARAEMQQFFPMLKRWKS